LKLKYFLVGKELDNKKRNIAIIIPNLNGGGAERTASKLSLYFSKNKFDKYIIVFDKNNIDYHYEGNLISLNTKASHCLLGKIIVFFRRIYKVKKLKRKYHIQSSISFLDSANIVNLLSKTEDKIILSIRNFKSKSSNSFYAKIHAFLIKIYYNKANALVAVSKSVKEDLIKNFGIDENKIKVIYNFYNTKKIKELSKKNIEEKYKKIFNYPIIITMGRLKKQKGQWHLIRAFKKVKEKIPDFKLAILGQGKLEGYLKQLVKEMDLKKDVCFIGFQKNPFKFISKSTMFVFPSLYEGFPNALVEAMACGIPVISSDCSSGPREILAPNTDMNFKTNKIEYVAYGVLIPVCDGSYLKNEEPLTKEEKFLTDSIIEMYNLNDMRLKYSDKSLKRVKDFEAGKIIKEYEKIIK